MDRTDVLILKYMCNRSVYLVKVLHCAWVSKRKGTILAPKTKTVCSFHFDVGVKNRVRSYFKTFGITSKMLIKYDNGIISMSLD